MSWIVRIDFHHIQLKLGSSYMKFPFSIIFFTSYFLVEIYSSLELNISIPFQLWGHLISLYFPLQLINFWLHHNPLLYLICWQYLYVRKNFILLYEDLGMAHTRDVIKSPKTSTISTNNSWWNKTQKKKAAKLKPH